MLQLVESLVVQPKSFTKNEQNSHFHPYINTESFPVFFISFPLTCKWLSAISLCCLPRATPILPLEKEYRRWLQWAGSVRTANLKIKFNKNLHRSPPWQEINVFCDCLIKKKKFLPLIFTFEKWVSMPPTLPFLIIHAKWKPQGLPWQPLVPLVRPEPILKLETADSKFPL